VQERAPTEVGEQAGHDPSCGHILRAGKRVRGRARGPERALDNLSIGR
jgi:hypothetical protein